MTDRVFSLEPYFSAVTVIAGMGINVDAVVKMAGLPAGVLVDPKVLITARQFHQMVSFGRSLFSDPAFSLNIADIVRLEMVDVIGPMFATTENLRSYLVDSTRFMPMIDPCIDVVFEEDENEVRFYCDIAPDQGVDDRFLHAEAAFAIGYKLLAAVFKRPEFAPVRLELQHDGSAWMDQYRRHFGANIDVRFNAPRNVSVLRREWLEIPNPGHSPTVHALMQKNALARLNALPGYESTGARVMRFLDEESGRRVLDLADVAAHLGIASRTLQRLLAEENTSFQKLRDSLRFRRACTMLQARDTDIATIAATLGFSEPATFHRAFKSWSGMSPSEYRRRNSPSR